MDINGFEEIVAFSKITDRSIIASLNHNQFEFADDGYAFYDYIENGILKSKEINKKIIYILQNILENYY